MIRPIPDAPNLEFERKAAKALLRALKAGDPEAIARATSVDLTIDAPIATLADAQRVIAREYGFASWTRLTRYFRMVQEEAPPHPHSRPEERGLEPPDWLERRARGLVAEQQARGRAAGYTLARYLPRLYGAPLDEVFASTITIDEAQLAIAQREGFRSWEALLTASAAQLASRKDDPWLVDDEREATHAIRDESLARLRTIVARHPEWRTANDRGALHLEVLLDSAVRGWGRTGRALPPDDIVDWLVQQGARPQPTLDRALEGHMYMQPAQVRWLLARGANPRAIVASGLSMLETAIIRWWNGEAVDLLAPRAAVPRDALWVHAGLGDVDAVKRWIDPNGTLRSEARQDRPPFHRAGGPRFPMHPDPDDEELLLEVFWVATLNGRRDVMRLLAQRGFDVDTLRWEMPLVVMAVGNGWLSATEALVQAGANLDLRGQYNGTAREMARELWLDRADPAYRPIVELVGLDPDALLRERSATPPVAATLSDRLGEALRLATRDAMRRGRESVDEESLFFGLMAARRTPAAPYVRWARGFDARRFIDTLGERLRPARASDHRGDVTPGDEDAATASDDQPLLPFAPDAQAVVDAAIAERTARYRADVGGDALLWALLRDDTGFTATLLIAYGADIAHLREEAGRWL